MITWTCLGVLISVACQGMITTFMMRPLPEPDLKTDLQTAYWIGPSPSATFILGILLTSILMEVIGRKLAYITLMIPGCIGLVQLYTASSETSIIAGKMLGAVSIGSVVTLAAVVIGEYSSPEHRGMFLHLKTAAFSLGSTIYHVLASYYDWRTIALVILILNVISCLIVCSWLESPSWLAMKGKSDASERNFYFLRGRSHNIKAEFNELIRVQTEVSARAKSSYLEILRKFIKRSFLRPLFIMFMCTLLLEMSGRHIIPTYASRIVDVGDESKPLLNFWIDVIVTISATLSAILIKFTKTRTLLFSTGSASLLMLLAANTYLFLFSNKLISNNHPWLPTSMFTIYLVLANLGCTVIPLALVGEIFPLVHKGTGLFVFGILSLICIDTTLKIFPYLLDTLKIYGAFAVVGMIKTIILMILFFVLPETKNKTLQEIEDGIKYGQVGVANSLPDYEEKDCMLS